MFSHLLVKRFQKFWSALVLIYFIPGMQRENAVDDFRAGKTWVLIATDVIARGMDFKGVNCVINYDFPDSAAAYIHRIGMLLLLHLLRTMDRCHRRMVDVYLESVYLNFV